MGHVSAAQRCPQDTLPASSGRYSHNRGRSQDQTPATDRHASRPSPRHGIASDLDASGPRAYNTSRIPTAKEHAMAATFLLLFLFGGVVGTMSGLLGIGGGVALVPGLMWLFGFTQQEAQGTSLAVLIPPIGIFAA